VDVTNIVKWRDKVKDAFEKREGEYTRIEIPTSIDGIFDEVLMWVFGFITIDVCTIADLS
jgi:hypothetical protein